MIDLDSMADIKEARAALGPKVCIAGNIDPVSVLKDSSPKIIAQNLESCRNEAGNPYIAGAGCEVPRGAPTVHMEQMMKFSLEQ